MLLQYCNGLLRQILLYRYIYHGWEVACYYNHVRHLEWFPFNQPISICLPLVTKWKVLIYILVDKYIQLIFWISPSDLLKFVYSSQWAYAVNVYYCQLQDLGLLQLLYVTANIQSRAYRPLCIIHPTITSGFILFNSVYRCWHHLNREETDRLYKSAME